MQQDYATSAYLTFLFFSVQQKEAEQSETERFK